MDRRGGTFLNAFLRQMTCYLVIVLVVIVLFSLLSSDKQPELIQYDEFVRQVENGQVETVYTYGDEIEAELRNGTRVKTYRQADHPLTPLLLEKDIHIVADEPKGTPFWQ